MVISTRYTYSAIGLVTLVGVIMCIDLSVQLGIADGLGTKTPY
jgi:hypothetical protein